MTTLSQEWTWISRIQEHRTSNGTLAAKSNKILCSGQSSCTVDVYYSSIEGVEHEVISADPCEHVSGSHSTSLAVFFDESLSLVYSNDSQAWHRGTVFFTRTDSIWWHHRDQSGKTVTSAGLLRPVVSIFPFTWPRHNVWHAQTDMLQTHCVTAGLDIAGDWNQQLVEFLQVTHFTP